jgi:hypothetical protein
MTLDFVLMKAKSLIFESVRMERLDMAKKDEREVAGMDIVMGK